MYERSQQEKIPSNADLGHIVDVHLKVLSFGPAMIDERHIFGAVPLSGELLCFVFGVCACMLQKVLIFVSGKRAFSGNMTQAHILTNLEITANRCGCATRSPNSHWSTGFARETALFAIPGLC